MTTTESGRETRVSTVGGDRYCTGCGYNLVGQSVVREPHHGLLVVRCPECGTVAPVQEYPTLGRWARRWAALLAGLWTVAALVLWIGGSGILTVIAIASAEQGGWRVTDRVRSQAAAWVTTQDASVNGWWQISVTQAEEWWRLQGGWSGWLSKEGGLARVVAPADLVVLGVAALGASFVLGCAFSLAMAGVPRRRLPLLLPVVMAWLLLFAGLAALAMLGPGSSTGSSHLMVPVQRNLQLPLLGLALLLEAGGLLVGLLAGRSVARGLVRLLVPPRYRLSLAVLWAIDGLDPRARRR